MPSLIKRRSRTVSFRVSEEEYLNLCQATDSAGAHSISDFARHVTCHHSLVLVNTAQHGSLAASASSSNYVNGTHHNNNGNGVGGGSGIHASHAELHPAPAMAMEINRLKERIEDVERQMQTLSRRVSRI